MEFIGGITGIIPLLIIVVVIILVFRYDKQKKRKMSVANANNGNRQCPKCGEPMVEDAVFCRNCGVNINDTNTQDKILPKYCHNCGKEIDQADSGSEFCKYCGVSLSKANNINIHSEERHVGVSVIAWMIIVISAIDWLISLGSLASGERILGLSPSVIKWALFSDIILIALAIGMLKGKNSCRITYLVFYPISAFIATIVGGIAQPASILIYIVWYIVSLIILTQSNASRFFKAN